MRKITFLVLSLALTGCVHWSEIRGPNPSRLTFSNE